MQRRDWTRPYRMRVLSTPCTHPGRCCRRSEFWQGPRAGGQAGQDPENLSLRVRDSILSRRSGFAGPLNYLGCCLKGTLSLEDLTLSI